MDATQREMMATIARAFRRTAVCTGLAAPSPAVARTMAMLPRAWFVPAEVQAKATADEALPLAHGQSISQPFMVALMTTLLEPGPAHRVLEVGTGSGYQAAILGELAGEVHTVERVPELASSARALLARLGYRNVHVHTGDGAIGLPDHGPFDRILVACAAERVPVELVRQLNPGGRLVIPVGPQEGQLLRLVARDATNRVHVRDVLEVRFVPCVTPAPQNGA